MKVIGLTGSVGSGKSTVAKMMEEKFHAYVIYTDEVAKDFMKPGQVSYQLTLNYFGTNILFENGEIDRGKLASIVFQDEKKLATLNSFIHPYVKEYVLETIEKVKESGVHSYCVVETALLLQAGYTGFCDEIWIVTLMDEIRRKRLKESRGYSDEKIDSILKNQLSEQKLRDAATHIIENNGDIDKLEQEIQFLLEI